MTTLSQFRYQCSTEEDTTAYALMMNGGNKMKTVLKARQHSESGLRYALVAGLSIAILMAVSNLSFASSPKDGPFDSGKIRGSVFGSYSNNSGYLVLGGGVGYFVWNGVELGVDSSIWLLEEPMLIHVSPKATYYLALHRKWIPYAGVFYRHIFVESAPDQDSVGARLGIGMQQGPITISLGIVGERDLPCNATRFADADQTECNHFYPEFGFGISF
jgi:hypothetical protein